MNPDSLQIAWEVFLVIVSLGIGLMTGFLAGAYHQMCHQRRGALAAGVGEYTVDKKTGATEFRYKTTNL